MKSTLVKIVYNCNDRLAYSCFTMPAWELRDVQFGPDKINILQLQDINSFKSHYVSTVSPGGGQLKNSNYDNSNVLSINGNFAKCLNLNDGDEIMVVREISETPMPISQLWVNCESGDDWEILEPNAEILTNNLLNQIRIVYLGLKFPFWITKSMSINLIIDKLEPNCEYGLLNNSSEVIIPSIVQPSRQLLTLNNHHLHLRLHPIVIKEKFHNFVLLPSVKLLLTNIHHAFICEAAIKHHLTDFSSLKSQQNFFFAKLINNSSDKTESTQAAGATKNNTQEQESSIILKVFILELLDLSVELIQENFPLTNPACLYVHPCVFSSKHNSQDDDGESFCMKSNIMIEQVDEKMYENYNQTIHFSPLQITREEQVFESNYLQFGGYKNLIRQGSEFLSASLSLGNIQHDVIGPHHGNLLIAGKEGSGKSTLAFQLTQQLEGFPYYIHSELIQCAKLRGKKPESLEKELFTILEKASKYQPSIVILDDFNVLVPNVLSEQQNFAEEFQHYRTSETIHACFSNYKSQQISFIATSTHADSINTYWKTRSGFHFFQLHLCISPPDYKDRLDIFQKCLHRYQMLPEKMTPPTSTCVFQFNRNNIKSSTISTEERMKEEASNTRSKTGSNLSLESTSRLNISKLKLLNDTTKEVEYHCYCCFMSESMKSSLESVHDEFVTAQFLSNLAKKWSLYLFNKEEHRNDDIDKDKMFSDLIQDEINRLENVSNDTKSVLQKKISWNQIGGLNDVKNELIKILQWPIKYAKLFENSPVKLPSGILFYGFPGTGKTLLGLSLPTVINAKFIHVKGPELLSKYIGASEQAVKDIFRRAKESKPCILFFDEFDSLVPRRGHDSTGVTDRVVNQFLAEMDGVDGGLGLGVYLIASSSRPDLIDPAILRPGRLDKLLFFPLPTQEERIEILKRQSEQMNLSQWDLNDWNEIGHETEGFTGADLHSLLFSAQLIAIHETLDKLNINQVSEPTTTLAETLHDSLQKAPIVSKSDILITSKHMKESLNSFQPSLYGKELENFQNIYQNFALTRSGQRSLQSGPASSVQQRATLA